jgi:hypothetical protein
VGALNPNGAKAMYTNDGPWVYWWAPSVALISTYPAVRGSRGPVYTAPASNGTGLPRRRETYDTDDFVPEGSAAGAASGGWATWEGTSFGTVVVGAEIAAMLEANAQRDAAFSLAGPDRAKTIKRTRRAIDAVAQ